MSTRSSPSIATSTRATGREVSAFAVGLDLILDGLRKTLISLP
jgi:hypothetical protein